jgi:nitrous oxidase accessory protein NosD
MTRSMNRFLRIASSAVAGIGCLFLSENISLTKPESLISQAEARIGRPLTPMSYAGVARRTTRRAVVGGAAVGAAAAGAYYYGAGCVQVVDPYGRIVTQCQ